MLTRRERGFIELIPNPREKRDAVLRDHGLALLANLHGRLARLERIAGVDPGLAEEFEAVMRRIGREEEDAKRVHDAVRAGEHGASSARP